MDEQEHKDFLTGIAKEVGKRIVKPANLNRFRQQDRIFWELCKVYCQAVEQDRQAAESNPRLRDKEAGPPKKYWVWYDQERSKTIPVGYWRRPEKNRPPNPLKLLSFPKNEMVEFMFPPQAPRHQIEKALPAYYAFFTVIHDHDSYRVDDIKINNGIWPEDEGWVRGILEEEINWKYFKELDAGNRLRAYIELALEHVKTDLDEKPAEPERNTKTTIAAIIISLIMIFLFVLSVYLIPLTWIKNHPNSYSLQGSIICLIPCLVVGFFKSQSRKWWWGGAALAFLVLLISLLGGPGGNNVNS